MSGWLKRTGSPILYGCAFFSMLLRLLLLLPTQMNDKTVGSFDASLHCTCALLFPLRMMTPLVNQTQNRVFMNIKNNTRTASEMNSAYDSYIWTVSVLQQRCAAEPFDCLISKPSGAKIPRQRGRLFQHFRLSLVRLTHVCNLINLHSEEQFYSNSNKHSLIHQVYQTNNCRNCCHHRYQFWCKYNRTKVAVYVDYFDLYLDVAMRINKTLRYNSN